MGWYRNLKVWFDNCIKHNIAIIALGVNPLSVSDVILRTRGTCINCF